MDSGRRGKALASHPSAKPSHTTAKSFPPNFFWRLDARNEAHQRSRKKAPSAGVLNKSAQEERAMLNPTGARLSVLNLLLLLLTFAFIPTAAIPPPKSDDGLVVHEWGTFTTVRNKEGQALLWRPLSFESDLPKFVYSVDRGQSWKANDLTYRTKSATPVTVRMETPVIYFYATQQTDARVRVGFPGIITEWYPQAQLKDRGIEWNRLRIFPDLRVELPHSLIENHYYAARETDGSILELSGDEKNEYEKFLFYRGVGSFSLPVSLKLQADRVAVTNTSEEKQLHGILFENRSGQIGFTTLKLSEPEATIDRPTLGTPLADLRKELRTMLIEAGLFEKEADAMLNTWRDSWFEEGLRLFYVMPRTQTDTILPLKVEPEPKSIVRVMVGRTELITPDAEKNVSAQLLKLNDPSPSVRTAARKQIDRYGRFVESILTQISAAPPNPRVKAAAQRLLEELRQVGG